MNERIKPLAGGRFLFEDDRLENLFSPEHFSEEHKMIMETTNEFMEHQVLPVEERLEDGDFELMTALMKKAGELGLLSTDIPQAYGGLELDKASSMIICESVAKQSSFSITLSGQTGIGSLPIVFFGTEAQKAKYLPDLTTGEKSPPTV